MPGALLPFLASLALCFTLLAGFADLQTILHKQAHLAEVTIQIDVVGARTTRSTTSFGRQSSSTSRSSATSSCTTCSISVFSLRSASRSSRSRTSKRTSRRRSRGVHYMIKPLIVSIRSEEPEDDAIECNPTGDKH